MMPLTNTRLVLTNAFRKTTQLTMKQKYYSIQARGENLEEVLRAHEQQGDGALVYLLYAWSESSHIFSDENFDIEDGKVDAQNDHDHQAKKDIPEETADHGTKHPRNGPQVSLEI